MTVDPFAAPTEKAQEPTSTGGSFVPFKAMTNRLMLIMPVEFERSVKSNFPDKAGNDQYGPRLTADIAILSGEPEFYWKNGEKNAEFEADEIPCVFEGVWIQSAPIVDRTEDARRTDIEQTMTIGLLLQEKAYILKDPSDKQKAVARNWLSNTPAGKAFAAKAQGLHNDRVAGKPSVKSEDATPFS